MNTLLRSLVALVLAAMALSVIGCSKSEVAPAKTTATTAAGELLAAKTAATPDWLAQQIAAYPMQTCAVSNDKLGGSIVTNAAGQIFLSIFVTLKNC